MQSTHTKQENAGSMCIQTVEYNFKLYTKWQIARATQAKDFYDNLLCLSVEDFHNIISTEGIQECQVAVEDVTTAKKIWGPSVTKAKGNTVQQPAKAGPMSIVSVPKELLQAQKKVTLCIDFFYINQKHIFLMTYSENIVSRLTLTLSAEKWKIIGSFSRTYTKSIWCMDL